MVQRLNELSGRDLLAAYEGAKDIARGGILPFTCWTKPNYRINWHHRLIAEKLDRFMRGECKRLLISAPPQAGGKSELVSRRMPALILGREPTAQVLCGSYAADLIQTMSRKCRAIMEQPEYAELFPKVKVGGKLKSKEDDWETSTGGRYMCAGVNGGFTGNPGDYVLLDDLIKGRQEANSPTIRKRAWGFIEDDILSRIGAHGSCLLMATRWHDEDPTGMILSMMENDENAEQWETLFIPARLDSEEDRVPGDPRQIGDPMWPWYYAGKRDDIPANEQIELAKQFLARWEARNPLGFSSLAQQKPTPLKGSMFGRDWFKFISRPEIPSGMRLIRYWDRAATLPTPKNPNPDWTAGALVGMHNDELYILDMVHFRGDSAENRRVVRQTAEQDGPGVAIVIEHEGGSSGVDSFDEYQLRVLKGFPVSPDRPSGEKALRAAGWSALAKTGHVYLVRGQWNADFLTEAVSFPNGKKDQIDAVSGGYKFVAQTFDVGDMTIDF